MDAEPIEYGVANGDVHMPQMAGEGDEKTEIISVQDSVVREAWRGWEDNLRTAHRMRWVAAAALQNRLRGEPSECVTRLMLKEGENLKKWKEVTGHSGSPAKQAERRALRKCDPADAERRREPEEVEGVLSGRGR